MIGKIKSNNFWDLYKKLPKKIQDAIFSENTGNNIEAICKKFKIEENFDFIADLISQTLLGLLPVNNFQKTLEQELKLEKEQAKKISQEVNQLIFDPVKDSLTEISNEKTLPKKEIKLEDLRKPAYPEGGDTYREPVE